MTHKIEHNVETGQIIQREMTNEELAELEADKSRAQQRKFAEAETAASRAALLEKLGITEQEAKLLLGGN